MFKRFLLVSASVLIAIPLLVTNVNAAIYVKIGGVYIKVSGSYELHAQSFLSGFGFCEDLEDDIQCAKVGAEVTVNQAACGCMNPGGNCGGVGGPFYPGDVLSLGELITSGDIFGRGTAVSDICWYSDYIAGELNIPPNYCDQNDNWLGVCGDCYITNADATFVGCDVDKDGSWWQVTQLTLTDCKADIDALQSAEVGEEVVYNCGSSTSSKNKLGQVPCPFEIPTPDCMQVQVNENGCVTSVTDTCPPPPDEF